MQTVGRGEGSPCSFQKDDMTIDMTWPDMADIAV